MPIPSGLSAQAGFVDETVYGTPVVVTRFHEFRTESLKMQIDRIESTALRSGQRTLRSDRWTPGKKSVGGDVEFEVANKSFGLQFKHMFGGVVSAQPSVGPDPTMWKHTFTPGDLPVSQTGQVGRTDVSGVTRAFTYHGLRVASWELACAVGNILTLKNTYIGEDEDTSTGLAVASYPASLSLLTFVNGTLTIGGSAADIKSATVKGNNGLADDRYFLGNQLRKQPLEKAMRDYGGQFAAEFESLTAYNRYINGTEAAVVLLFQGATISNANKFEVKVTMNVRFDGETPTVGGAEIIQLNLPYKVVDDGTTSIKLEYQTTDVTP